MKIQTNVWYSQDELWQQARDAMGIISIVSPTPPSDRKTKLIPIWEQMFPTEFSELRGKDYNLPELAGMLNSQAQYMKGLSQYQIDSLLESLGIVDTKDVFKKVIELFIEISNVPNVQIVALETAKDSSYIVSPKKDQNGDNRVMNYQWKTRPVADFGKEYIEKLVKSFEHAGKSVRHMIIAVLVPFTSAGIIQRHNFYKVAGVCSQIDWVLDNNVKSTKNLIPIFQYRNLWS